MPLTLPLPVPAAIRTASVSCRVLKARCPDRWAHQSWLLPSSLGCRVSFAHLASQAGHWAGARTLAHCAEV